MFLLPTSVAKLRKKQIRHDDANVGVDFDGNDANVDVAFETDNANVGVDSESENTGVDVSFEHSDVNVDVEDDESESSMTVEFEAIPTTQYTPAPTERKPAEGSFFCGTSVYTAQRTCTIPCPKGHSDCPLGEFCCAVECDELIPNAALVTKSPTR